MKKYKDPVIAEYPHGNVVLESNSEDMKIAENDGVEIFDVKERFGILIQEFGRFCGSYSTKYKSGHVFLTLDGEFLRDTTEK